MKNEVFSNISKIIERDSKSTTYKFALLRGVIDIIQDNSPFITFSKDKVYFPTGLLVEKWMLYYYPILESAEYIPQINGKVNLAFGIQFKEVIKQYNKIGGFSAFYNDLKNKGIPNHLHFEFISLAKKIKDTIMGMPMKHIGYSLNNGHYSIFQKETVPTIKTIKEIDLEVLIKNFGTFSIPIEYYEAFQILGSFISGQDSILFKWAEFSVKASKENLSFEKAINYVLKSPVTEREASESKRIFTSLLKKEGNVFCVWSGNSIEKYEVDHVIPFSIWKNNDFWNLLPSDKKTNNHKRDKIPSISLIENRKDLIIQYWELLNKNQSERFQKEIQVALLGNNSKNNWKVKAFEHLKSSCNYLINGRGFTEWNGKQ
jgi:hypothetical protein